MKKIFIQGLVPSAGQRRMIVRLGKRILFAPIIIYVHVKRSSLKLMKNVKRVSVSAVEILFVK